MRSTVIFSAVTMLFFGVPQAGAVDLATQKQALDIIQDFAADFCKDPPLEGGTDKLELSGSAKAQLDGLLAKLAALGIEGTAKYTTDSYKGLLQKDLTAIVAHNQNCRDQIWHDLQAKLIVGQNDLERTTSLIAGIDFTRLRTEIEIPAVYSVSLTISSDPNATASRSDMNGKIRYSLAVIRQAGYGVKNNIYDRKTIAHALCPYATRLNRNLDKFDVAAKDGSYELDGELPDLFQLCQGETWTALN